MTEPPTPSDSDSGDTATSATDDDPSAPPTGSSPDPYANPIARVPGGYRTLAAVLGLAGVASLLHLAQRGLWVRILALLFVGLGARVLWGRLHRPVGLGSAFSFGRAAATTLLCAALAGFGVVQTSPLLGVVAATLALLVSWLTSPRGPAAPL